MLKCLELSSQYRYQLSVAPVSQHNGTPPLNCLQSQHRFVNEWENIFISNFCRRCKNTSSVMAFCGTSSQFGTVVFNSEKAFQKNDLCSPDICNFILGK